jgi:alpha-L-rhamnosidase
MRRDAPEKVSRFAPSPHVAFDMRCPLAILFALVTAVGYSCSSSTDGATPDPVDSAAPGLDARGSDADVHDAADASTGTGVDARVEPGDDGSVPVDAETDSAAGDARSDAAADAQAPSTDPQVTRRRVEYQIDPLGIDVAKPRFDWVVQSSVRGQRQTAYRILVSGAEETLNADRGDLWDSGKVQSDRSNQIEYGGTTLGSRQRAFWKVQIWDKDAVASAWSAVSRWEMGLVQPADWQAKWIAAPGSSGLATEARWIWFPEGDPASSAPVAERYFRKSFTVPTDTTIAAATCDISADDEFELFINGKSIGAGTDWKDVPHFSVGDALMTGTNVVAIRAKNDAVGPAGLILTLGVKLANGSALKIVSDASFQASSGPASAIAGFEAKSYDDAAWPAAQDIAAYGAGPWGRPVGGSAPVYLRKPFSTTAKVARARVYVTALGLYELWLNGQRVGVDHLTPGWTDYRKRLQVQTYDVTDRVVIGPNAIGAIIADGWFNGKVGYWGRTDVFGTGPNRLLAQLEIRYEDGSAQTVATDGTGANAWKWSVGPLLDADLLNGETCDARLELDGWSTVGFDDAAWQPAQVQTETSTRRLVSDPTPAIRVIKDLAPISVKETQPGLFIYDFGQNMVGWARLRVQGSRGSKLKLRFAEVLNPDGTLYTTNLRGARATDTYTLRGGAPETFEPRFTTHGFRFAEISGDIAGLASKPTAATLTGVVAHSFMPSTGVFETSSSIINQLQSNIVWGQRGNFLSVPTDCPQRDERLGWTADAQIFARTATFNMDVASFFTKWTRDLDDSQTAAGAYPNVAPNPGESSGTPAWADAGVIVPWTMYLAYGDTRILAEHYAGMAAWVEYVRNLNPGFLWQNSRASDFGDWLSINADSDKEVLATAFYAHSADIVGRAARVLGKTADADKYASLFASIKAAFNTAYVAQDGTVRNNTQTIHALALRFDLLPAALRASVVKRIADDVAARGSHLSSGFLGVAHLLPALTAGRRTDVAYQLLNQETFPSWLYSIKKGATTIWERWDGIQENGSFQTPIMNSFNHYSLGSVGEWMYAAIAGIDLDEAQPGYKHVIVRPEPGGGLTSARGTLETILGTFRTSWTVTGGVFTLDLSVPVNATASVFLPAGQDARESGQVATPGTDGSYSVGSGTYRFTVTVP